MSKLRRSTPRRARRRGLRIGVFGGTFDPIHSGHLALARAALRRFRLDWIHFIPCGRPPHKDPPGFSAYLHRFTMVALACADEPRFLPSLLEGGPDLRGRRRIYSIETVRRLRHLLGPQAQLYFLLGVDAFLDLPAWKSYRQLVRLCDFIVASRPGFDLRRAWRALPAELIRSGRKTGTTIPLERTRIYLLPGVQSNVSATVIRQRARRGLRLAPRVPAMIEDYIVKMKLYRREK